MTRRGHIIFDPMELLNEFAKGAAFGLGVRLTSGKPELPFFRNWKMENELCDDTE